MPLLFSLPWGRIYATEVQQKNSRSSAAFLCASVVKPFAIDRLRVRFFTKIHVNSWREFMMFGLYGNEVTHCPLTSTNFMFLYKLFKISVTWKVSNDLWEFKNFNSFDFWRNFWMSNYKGAFRNSTMSGNSGIPQIEISWILIKKQTLSNRKIK